jgi:hypothetical protein
VNLWKNETNFIDLVNNMPFSLITAEITTDGIIKSVELGKILMR